MVPASSASLGYVLIAGGDVELALIIALISLGGSLATTPAYLSIYASSLSLKVPVGKVAYVMALTLLTPLALGQLIRHALVKGLGKPLGEGMKPYLSLATMLTMLALITNLVAGRARLMTTNPRLAALVVCLQALSMTSVILASAALSALAGLSHGECVAVAFLSSLKNQSVAAAVAVTALGLRAGLVPALVPAIQAPLAIAYLHLMPALTGVLKQRSIHNRPSARSA